MPALAGAWGRMSPAVIAPRATLAVLLAALVAVAGLTACSGDGEEEAATTTTTTTRPPPSTPEDAALEVRRADLVGPGDPAAALPANVRDDIVRVVQEFLRKTSAAPILSGLPASGFEPLMTSEALARATGPDLGPLTENGAPASRRLTVREAAIDVFALVGDDGAYQLAVTDVVWDIGGSGGARPIDVRRTGEITLLPAPQGGWLISSYDLHVTRKLGNAPATTTTAGGGD